MTKKQRQKLSRRTSGVGYIYTLHFLNPIGGEGRKGAQHYTGWAKDSRTLEKRIRDHALGLGARITAAVACAPDNSFVLATVQRGDKNEERRLKNAGHHDRRCPVCKGKHEGYAVELTSPTDYSLVTLRKFIKRVIR